MPTLTIIIKCKLAPNWRPCKPRWCCKILNSSYLAYFKPWDRKDVTKCGRIRAYKGSERKKKKEITFVKHNIWGRKNPNLDKMPWEGQKTISNKALISKTFAVYFWKEKTSKLDSAQKECPAASELFTALSLLEEWWEGESTSGMLLGCLGRVSCVWQCNRPPEKHWALCIACSYLRTRSSNIHTERLAFNGG